MRVLVSFLSIATLIVAGVFVSSAAADSSPSIVENTDSATPVAADTDGRAQFKKCQGCHAKDGSGQSKLGQKYGAPDFRDPAWQKANPLAKVKEVTRRGVPDTKMKPFSEKRLNDAQLDAVAKFIKSLGR